ncbi:hypothetical protein HPB51_025968 [Rhipicephalus microplus]|uniref:Uncharacterized protein n=1 Tax=Rhipicephalus microplus TaxID=6941 RepID=A0A9J6EDF0_RHIMP|nr:hypothetical protein HPB51_025968 [Rhipicephalus microplus]
MAQPFIEPLRDDLHEETVLRSGRTVQQPAGPATVAMASDLAIAGTEASALPAGVLAKPQGDSTELASQTASLSRDAVHAPLDFASGTIPGATSVPSPEDRRNSSPVTASELCTVLQAIALRASALKTPQSPSQQPVHVPHCLLRPWLKFLTLLAFMKAQQTGWMRYIRCWPVDMLGLMT